MALAEAQAIAEAFVALISSASEKVAVAGSIRRRAATVGDIEIVAVPKTEPALDLFGVEIDSVDLLDRRLSDARERGAVDRRVLAGGVSRWGPLAKYLTFEGAAVDLFAPEPERFGWILALRTGPAAFSRQLVWPCDRRTKDGRLGLLPPHLAPRDGWLTERVSGRKIATPNEEDVFRLLGMTAPQPWERV